MEATIIYNVGVILVSYWDNRKSNESYYNIGVILGFILG